MITLFTILSWLVAFLSRACVALPLTFVLHAQLGKEHAKVAEANFDSKV